MVAAGVECWSLLANCSMFPIAAMTCTFVGCLDYGVGMDMVGVVDRS
ncbi:Hypothetical protein Cul210932_1922 [Corynebacterium ulcerans]|nr:Hypothetical protein Cul210932_1922 [Corynebacterium ulcerans]ALD95630.1 Hypothetical protein Cul131001_1954 [Corynebacterium ulcerans]